MGEHCDKADCDEARDTAGDPRGDGMSVPKKLRNMFCLFTFSLIALAYRVSLRSSLIALTYKVLLKV